jgi:hypothetical protein
VLEWCLAHPDIALVVVLGEANNLWTVPMASPPLDPGALVAVPWRLAHALGLEAGAEYPIQTVLDAAAEHGARANLSAARVRSLLHLEPLTAPPAGDLGWWRALADRYRAVLAEHGHDATRLAPPEPGPGSPASWAYFQYGAPTVALDCWTLPDAPDTAATDTTAVAPPAGPQPDRAHVLLKERTEASGHDGWRAWTEVELDGGQRALVGGPVPGAQTTPADYAATPRARDLLPFLLELPAWLPELTVDDLMIDDRGGGVLAVRATVRNPGRLPYPTDMGAVNRRPAPVTVILEGGQPLQDPPRRVVPQLPAGGAVTLTWLVRDARPGDLRVTASAPSLGTVTATGGQR